MPLPTTGVPQNTTDAAVPVIETNIHTQIEGTGRPLSGQLWPRGTVKL